MKEVLYFLKDRHEIDFVRNQLVKRHDDVIRLSCNGVMTEKVDYGIISSYTGIHGYDIDELYVSTSWRNYGDREILDELKKSLFPILSSRKGSWKYLDLGHRGYNFGRFKYE